MSAERLIATSEEDLQVKAAEYIGARILKFHQRSPNNFILGISGTNGVQRRNRAKEVFSALGQRESIDWNRVRVVLLDERYGFEDDNDCNKTLLRNSLFKELQLRNVSFPEEHFLAPDTTKGWQECADDYEQRLLQLFSAEGASGPTLVTSGLGRDGSLASIFPEWYKNDAERWAQVVGSEMRVLCTETSKFEVPKRISVNMRLLRNSQHVMIFLGQGTEEEWQHVLMTSHAPYSPTYSPPAPTGQGHKLIRKQTTAASLLEESSPVEYIMQHKYCCFVQVMKDVESHLNIVVLGAGGDLAKKKTFPAIFQLHLSRVLPSNVSFVGCDDPSYHKDIQSTDQLFESRLKKYLEQEGGRPSDLQDFKEKLKFVPFSLRDMKTVQELQKQLKSHTHGLTDNRIFYLALPPFLFGEAVKLIREECWPEGKGYVRVIVEKPFGHDLVSACKLADELSRHLTEPQIFRIDHYLAKTMVLNILTLRFANRELGKLFHADNVSNIRITFKEDFNVAGRAGYFDKYGIIRDVMQNHLLQLITLVLMEAPASLKPEDVRDEKVKVLKQIRTVKREDCVVGQYEGYQDDEDIKKINEKQGYKSKCPTYAACVLYLDNERWSNVPIIMKAGKSLEMRSTFVRLQFKKAPPHSLFGDQPQNELVIRIQPDEAIYYRILAKTPGLTSRTHEVQRTRLDLDLESHAIGRNPLAYEKLIHDVIQGASHNFVRRDEVEEGWRIFDPLLASLEAPDAPDPFPYVEGSRGPPEGDALIDRSGYTRYSHTGVSGKASDSFH